LVQNERSGWLERCADGAEGEGGGRRRTDGGGGGEDGVPVKLAGPGSAARRRSGWWVVVVAWWGLFATWATNSGRAQRRVFVGSFEPALLQIAGVTFAGLRQ
jgi:hypothetical protein